MHWKAWHMYRNNRYQDNSLLRIQACCFVDIPVICRNIRHALWTEPYCSISLQTKNWYGRENPKWSLTSPLNQQSVHHVPTPLTRHRHNSFTQTSVLVCRYVQLDQTQLHFLRCMTLKFKAIWFFEMPGTAAQQHIITSQKNWFFSNTAVGATNLACCYVFVWCRTDCCPR